MFLLLQTILIIKLKNIINIVQRTILHGVRSKSTRLNSYFQRKRVNKKKTETMSQMKLDEFSMTGNVNEKWRRWKNNFNNYLIANDLDEKTEKRKIAVFLMFCGPELKDKYNQFNIIPIPPENSITLNQVIQEFDKKFKSYSNEVFSSYLFWSPNLKQNTNERFETFYLKVKEYAIECNFEEATLKRNIRDKLLMGINNVNLRERLLRETVLTEKMIVEQCLISEQSHVQSELMTNGQIHENPSVNIEQIQSTSKKFNNYNEKFKCRNCGKYHEKKNCPAFGKKCHNCNKMNHYKTVCKSNRVNTNRQGQKQDHKTGFSKRIHEVKNNDEEDNEIFLSELIINSLNKNTNTNEWLTDILIDDTKIKCKLDTGAQVNVISLNQLKQFKIMPKITETKTIVKAFGGTKIELAGECILECSFKNKKNKFLFLITYFNSKPILGFDTCKFFNLLNSIDSITTHSKTPLEIIEEYADVFEGNGSLEPVEIKLKQNATPHIAAARKIPLALHEPVKTELNEMVKNGIIARVDKPTDWVSSMHVINKSGKIRIVLDPRPLNKCIKRAHYPIPTIEEQFSKLQGCKIFTLLDAKTAFWQQPLDEKSSYLTTFITPFGRFRWLKLPYGLINAPENFQFAMTKIFQNIPQVNPYFDDIAIGSNTLQEHCLLLRKVLNTARKHNLKFNKSKIQLATKEIKYLGQILTHKGILPDPRKIKAIAEFPTPTNKDSLNRFLCMFRYHTKYTPNVSNESFGLRQLLKKNVHWVWDENATKCFNTLKSLLIKAPILQIFNPNIPVKLTVDASKYGLGAALIQNEKPVSFGSASLNLTQQSYAQIEKELLAVVFGLEHFHYYTYGRKILVETDHKPLLGLSRKPYDQITPRLQNMLLKLNKYDIELKYIPGKDLITADTLSRAPLQDSLISTDNIEGEFFKPLKVHLLVTATDEKWNKLRNETVADTQLQAVIFYINNGWPDSEKKLKNNLAKEYWHCRDELYIKDNIVCRGKRLVVPTKSIDYILTLIHASHRGIVSNKIKAREHFYWPNMDRDIEKIVNNCNVCQKYKKSNQFEPLLDRDLPSRPWQKVAADFFDLNGKRYLLIIDYFTKYIEIQQMNTTNANAVITAFKSCYARFSIPDELITDQGPPFNSTELKNFHSEWNIHHNPSTPYYPRSNGQVERCIQTIKKSLLKCIEKGGDPYLVLLDYRTTATYNMQSPAELLMGRKLKSNLPIHPTLLKPNYKIKMVQDELKRRQIEQKKTC